MAKLQKHIYKKFYNELTTPKDVLDKLPHSGIWDKVKSGEIDISKLPKNYKATILMDSGKLVQAFPFNDKGARRLIPEPDPILIYFHTAYVYFRQIESKKTKVLNNSVVDVMTEDIINDLYDYYGLACSCIILLFTSLEAFINRSIPDDFEYKKTGNPKRTEIYNKQQIQWLSFDEKMERVLPLITEKDFGKAHPNINQHIKNLKDFRNNIVHTRESADGHTPFDYLYKRSFQFNYEAALNAVKDFCNFYMGPDYIIECSCANNW